MNTASVGLRFGAALLLLLGWGCGSEESSSSGGTLLGPDGVSGGGILGGDDRDDAGEIPVEPEADGGEVSPMDSGIADTGPGPRPIPPPTFVETPSRVVAIGDVHGDLASTRAALLLAGAIDAEDRWIGGDMVVVQVGDQLDRGGDERAILDLLERLSDEAHAAGGALYPLLGNHEVMNVELDLRYVFDEGWDDFEEFAAEANPNDPDLVGVPQEYWGRIIAFRPGGAYARLLAGHNVAMVVNDTLFVHGGILPDHVSYDLDSLNSDTQAWMRSERGEPSILTSEGSPVWSRHYSRDTTDSDCQLLEQVLASASVRRMVVAHTVQDQGINAACGGMVWRVDVGLADYYGGPTQVLEIDGDQTRVLSSR